jgi:hypothetical protein
MTTYSLPPNIWGESMWKTFQHICFTYPENPNNLERTAIINFFNSMVYLIPCIDCREHFTKLLIKYPINNNNNNRTILLKWLETISNEVNQRLHKPLFNHQELYNKLNTVKIVNNPIGPIKKPCSCKKNNDK